MRPHSSPFSSAKSSTRRFLRGRSLMALLAPDSDRAEAAVYAGTRARSRARPVAEHALLRARGDEPARARVERAARESARAVGDRAVLVEEQPLVGAERAVEPHR